MNNEPNWKQYQQIRKYLDNLSLDAEVVHLVALHAASLGLERIALSVCRFNAERKTWRKHRRELTLSDIRAKAARSLQQARNLEAPFAGIGESVYTTQALDRHERWTDMTTVRALLQQVTEDWGAYPVSLEDAVEMKYPGKDAPKGEKALYNRTKQRLDYFRRKWRREIKDE